MIGRTRGALLAAASAAGIAGLTSTPATAAPPDAATAAAHRNAASQAAKPRAGKPRARKLVLVSTRERAAGAVRVGLRVAAPLHSLEVVLNGRRVARSDLPRLRGQRTRVSLGTLHGARFGRNRVVVRAVSRNERRSQVVRRVVTIRRSAPLVGVRRFEPIVQSRPARLDAFRSRAAHGGRLSYRWRVVGAPRNARATLRGANTARPWLTGSHPGRYQLALTVTESDRRGERAGRRGARSAQQGPAPMCVAPAATSSQLRPVAPSVTPAGVVVASTPLELLPPAARLETVQPTAAPTPPDAPPAAKAGAGCVLEIVTADVMPNTSAIGMAFDSEVQQTASDGTVQTGLRIGSTFIPTGTSGAYVTFLDSQTLELLSTSRVPAGEFVGTYVVLQAGQFVVRGHSLLVVITGAPGCCGDDPTVEEGNRGFTIVQTLGQSVDDADQNLGLEVGAGGTAPIGQPGEMTGYLQQGVALDGGTAPYTFVSPERVPFATQQGGPRGRTNTIQVGSATYTSTLPQGFGAGYQVLVTDAAQRPVLGTPTVFGTNDNAADSQQEEAMAALLYHALGTPGSTVFVQSIGSPRPGSPNAVILSQAIEALGGSGWIFLGLDGRGDYALVGGPPAPGEISSPADAAEASTRFSGGSSLQGTLRRRNDQALRATLANAVDPGASDDMPDYDLAQIVYQDPTPWPQTDTVGKRAATTWIAQQVGMTGGSCYQPVRPDFRSNYCDVGMSPSSMRDAVRELDYEQTSAFTETEFAAVQRQLLTELGAVGNVRAFVGGLQSVFGTARVDAAVDAQQIGGRLMDSIPYQEGDAVSGDLSLAGSILYLASDIPEVGEVLGPVASVLDIASELSAEDGEPEPYWEIQAKADELGGEAASRLRAVSDGMALYQDMIVSDYGKLMTVSANSTSKWSFSARESAEAENSITAGVERWLWTAIVPSAYELVKVDGVPPGRAEKAQCRFIDGQPQQWRPWRVSDSRTTLFPLSTWTFLAAPYSMYAMLHGKSSDHSSQPVHTESGLGDAMFDSVDQGGAGLVAPWLYRRAKWRIEYPKQIPPSTSAPPAACGVLK